MNQKDADKLNELRSYLHMAPFMLPMIEKRIKVANQKLLVAYAAQEPLLGPTAELAVLHDMEREINSKLKELEKFNPKGD